ncbi:MAG TPA: hypothetical protein VMB23_03555 [Spirochaetia bacterium]|jgi:hypothetical protein|nr:hypothetical protein [Spirochaetia bacterium]
MKKFIAAAVLAGMATVAFAQSNQVDVANLFVASDLTAAYPTTAAKGGLLSQKNSSNDTTVTYTYTAKLDDQNTVKGGAILDLYVPFVSGTDTAYQSQYAGYVAPFAQYQGFGVDAKATFPVIFYNPTDTKNMASAVNSAANYNAFKYGPVLKGSTNTYNPNNTAVMVANYQKVIYKYSFDKSFWVSGGWEADLSVVPTLWVADVIPQVSVAYGPAQLDTKVDFYNTYSDNVSARFTQTYLEPKLTYDLGSVGVSGLKPYVVGRYSLATTQGSYTNASQAWHDSRVQPGVAYTLTVKDVGTFGADASIRFNKIDNDATANKGFDASPYGDFRLNVTYSVKF